MNFSELEIYGSIINNTQEELKKITQESKNAADQIDKEWLQTLNRKCVLKTNNKAYTAKEAIREAKKQRDYIIASLSNGNYDPKLGEDLIYLNKIISSYNSSHDVKEADKKEALYTDAKTKKGLVIKKAIEESIKKIDEQINAIAISLEDLKSQILNCTNKEELEEIYKKSEKIFELNKFKSAMEKLLSYNGEITNSSNLAAMQKDLTEDAKNFIEMYYIFITDNNINMKKTGVSKVKTVSSSSKDKDIIKVNNTNVDKINEINYYLDIAKTKNDKKDLDTAIKLIKELKDEDVRKDLEAEAEKISKSIKPINDPKKTDDSKVKTVSSSSKDKDIIKEINQYLNIACIKNSKEALDDAIELIKELKDEDVRKVLEAEAEKISKSIKPINDPKKTDDSKVKTVSSSSKDKDIIKEINHYLDIAKTKNSKEALDDAIELIKELKDEDVRNDLEAETAQISERIKIINEAQELVEIVEKTEKSKDYKHAYDRFISLSDWGVKKELRDRLMEVMKKNNQRFAELMDKISNDIADDKEISEKDINELSDRYQYLNNSYVDDIKDDYNRIITIYNNQVQDEYQQELVDEDIKKYSVADRIIEFGGAIINFIAGTKIAKNFNKSKLRKLNEELLDVEDAKIDKIISDDEYDEMKAMIEHKIEKINKRISDSDVISGVRLFSARNKLAKKKPKLYKEGLDNSGFKQVKGNNSGSVEWFYKTKDTNRISKILTKGLSKKLRDDSIIEDKARVITILDQYLELISSGTYDEDYVNDAFDYLESVQSVLSEGEYLGYYAEIQMIDGYRKNNSGMPYHMNNTEDNHEVDTIINYYDSDAYQDTMRQGRYVKRK